MGQNAVEEIDRVTLGGNYGWRVLEGSRCTGLGPASCLGTGFTPPIAEYANTGFSGRCSVTGGYVYRGTRGNLPRGAYLYGDYCSGEIFILQEGVSSLLADTAFNLASFGEDQDGELYVVDLAGTLYRIVNPAASRFHFTLAPGGSLARDSLGEAVGVAVGSGRVESDAGSPAPGGFGLISFRAGDDVVSEAAVEAALPRLEGRIAVQVGGRVNTGVAIVNPQTEPLTVSFFFTDAAGGDFGAGTFAMAAGVQMARFLDQPPFAVEPGRAATFTFTASAPVAVAVLRANVNERGELLLAAQPVADTLSAPPPGPVLAHFADGGGWTTTLILTNTTGAMETGRVDFLAPDGTPVVVTVNGVMGASFPYAIPPRSALRLGTSASEQAVRSGSVRVQASAGAGPAVSGLLSLRQGGTTVTDAGLEARTGDAFQLFAEADRGIGVDTGLAIANTTGETAMVNLVFSSADGGSAGYAGTVTLPPRGQVSGFLNQFPGFEALPAGYQGVLRVSGSRPVGLVGVRVRRNARGEFLVADIPPVVEAGLEGLVRVLPHFVDGGGYQTRFVLVAPPGTSALTGVLRFTGTDGAPASLDIR